MRWYETDKRYYLQSYKAVLELFVPKYFGGKSLRNAEVVFCYYKHPIDT